jgi:hypothetical protein
MNRRVLKISQQFVRSISTNQPPSQPHITEIQSIPKPHQYETGEITKPSVHDTHAQIYEGNKIPPHLSLYIVQPTTFKPSKYPIVLCHGLFGYDKLGPKKYPFLQISYWKGISDALVELGCKVYIPHVGTVSSVRTRAHELRHFLETHLSGQTVNLVAHSMVSPQIYITEIVFNQS